MAPFAADNSVILFLPGDVSFLRNAQCVIFGTNLTTNDTGRLRLYMDVNVRRKRFFAEIQFACQKLYRVMRGT